MKDDHEIDEDDENEQQFDELLDNLQKDINEDIKFNEFLDLETKDRKHLKQLKLPFESNLNS